MTFFEKAQALPPVLCRLLAQQHCHPLTVYQIASACSHRLTVYQIDLMSNETSWDKINLQDLRAFTAGCLTNFDDPQQFRRISDYLSGKPTFAYLRKSPWYREAYLPLLILWLRCAVMTPPEWPPVRRLAERLRPLLGKLC